MPSSSRAFFNKPLVVPPGIQQGTPNISIPVPVQVDPNIDLNALFLFGITTNKCLHISKKKLLELLLAINVLEKNNVDLNTLFVFGVLSGNHSKIKQNQPQLTPLPEGRTKLTVEELLRLREIRDKK